MILLSMFQGIAQASLPGISDHSIRRGVSAMEPAMSRRAKFVGHMFATWLHVWHRKRAAMQRSAMHAS
jgi:hypothetical protein